VSHPFLADREVRSMITSDQGERISRIPEFVKNLLNFPSIEEVELERECPGNHDRDQECLKDGITVNSSGEWKRKGGLGGFFNE